MPKKLNLVGLRVGRITVVERIGSVRHNGRSNVTWQCICDCGMAVILTSNTLRHGGTRSCGCLKRENAAHLAKMHPLQSTARDLTGQKFGLLTAQSPTKERRRKSVVWDCLCSCGNRHLVAATGLLTGDTKSCGCTKGVASITHGATRHGEWTREYTVWAAMLQRCSNPNNTAFDRYGGRGITVCDRWKSFENFFSDMGPRPANMSIDRIDNNKGYEPNNCRWATETEQQRNKTSSRLLTWDGQTLCVSEWAELLGVPSRRIISRLARGWDVERALTFPLQN